MSDRRDDPLHSYYVVQDVSDVLGDLDAWRCPDCNSEIGPVTLHSDQLISAEVRHDLTCPWYQEAMRS